ncbi:MAG: hypothetical protein PHN57_05110 [Candidatus Omnitrophica bacterium]|nr:hypothetical protein [Candidatus Omnitrophota bacterium]
MKKRRGAIKLLLLGSIYFFTLFYIVYFWLLQKLREKFVFGGVK